MKQELKIDLPQKMISDVVRANMVKALGNKKDFLDAIVKSALEAKKDRYSDTTIYQDELASMIRVVAKETFKEWLDEQKAKIKTAIVKRLTKEKEPFIDGIADNIIEGLTKAFYVTITLKAD